MMVVAGVAPATSLARQPTPARLLAATNRLLAERDDFDLSLRAITAAAGANVAAVNYHFGSKDALLHAALERALRQHAEAQLAALAALVEAEPAPTLAQVIQAAVHPTLGVDLDGQARVIARVAARVLSGGSPALAEVAAQAYAATNERLFAMLVPQLPQLSAEELTFRMRLMASLVASLLASRVSRNGVARELAARGPQEAEAQTVQFLVGALQAPATISGRH